MRSQPLYALTVLFLMNSQAAVGSLTVCEDQPGSSGSGQWQVTVRPALMLPLSEPRILVLKSKRQLLLYSGGRVVRTYRIGLGFSPVGAKGRQGDGKTPEGDYYICSKNPASQFYLSLGLSYPNELDARRGLTSKLITPGEYNQIAEAIKHKSRPPWNTHLGGEVFIHGDGASRDWTWGCVALENDDIRELYNVVARGTAVTIQP